MKASIPPPIPTTPPEYWEDSRWANNHFSEIVEQHPNLWVAIVGQRIVAAGNVISKVRQQAQAKTNREHFPVVFAEKKIHVYQSQP
jgi:hypothetical protein